MSDMHSILRAISNTQKALTHKSLATASGVDLGRVASAMAIIDKLELIDIIKSPSGRIKGLTHKAKAKDCCTIHYVRISPGITVFYAEGEVFKQVCEGEHGEFAAIEQYTQKLGEIAISKGIPLVDLTRTDIIKRLADYADAVAHRYAVDSAV